MNFKEFKASLVFRKYSDSKILLRFIEYKIKNFFLAILATLNIFKFNSKKIIPFLKKNADLYFTTNLKIQ